MKPAGKFGTGHIVLAVVGGAVAGAAAALLTASKSGRDTRQKLHGYFDTATEKVSRIPEAFRSAGAAVKEAMSEEAAVSKHK